MKDVAADINPQAFIAQLTEEDHLLITLCKELYECRWEAILTDLINRLKGRPYVFKLPNKVRDDIKRIKQLRRYEEQYDIKLSEFY